MSYLSWKLAVMALSGRVGDGLKMIALVGAVALASLTTTSAVRGGLVNVDFQGQVTFSAVPGFTSGQTFSGSFVYDSAALPQPGGDSSLSTFNALQSLRFSVGGYSGAATPPNGTQITIDNDFLGFLDKLTLLSQSIDGLTGPAFNGRSLVSASLVLQDFSASAFGDASVLPASLSLADFSSGSFAIGFSLLPPSVGVAFVNGTLTSVESRVVTTPEPTSFSLALVGLCACLGGQFVFGASRQQTSIKKGWRRHLG